MTDVNDLKRPGSYDFLREAAVELTRALKDCIRLFENADKQPSHQSVICTGDRREMWDEIANKYGVE